MGFKIRLFLFFLLLLFILFSFFLWFKKPKPLPVEAPRISSSLMSADELGEKVIRGIKEENVSFLKELSSSDLKKEEISEVNLEKKWKNCGDFLNELEGRWELEKFKKYDDVAVMEISVKSKKGKRSALFILKKEQSGWKVRDFWYFQDEKNRLN